MQLLPMLQTINQKEEVSGEYIVTLLRAADTWKQLPSFTNVHALGQHALFQSHDPFNRIADHLVIFDTISHRIVASTRIIAWDRVAPLQPLGAFSCQQSFDISGLREYLPQTMEISRTFIAREHRNTAVILRLWSGILGLMQDYQAKYLMGVLALTSKRIGDIQMLMRRAIESMALNISKKPVRARNPLPDDFFAGCRDVLRYSFSLRSQLETMQARIAYEPHVNNHDRTIDFLVWVDHQALTHQSRSLSDFGNRHEK